MTVILGIARNDGDSNNHPTMYLFVDIKKYVNTTDNLWISLGGIRASFQALCLHTAIRVFSKLGAWIQYLDVLGWSQSLVPSELKSTCTARMVIRWRMHPWAGSCIIRLSETRPPTPGYFEGVSTVSKVHPQFSEPQAHEVAYPNFIVFLVKSRYALVFHKTILIKHRIIIEFPPNCVPVFHRFPTEIMWKIPMAWKPPYDGQLLPGPRHSSPVAFSSDPSLGKSDSRSMGIDSTEFVPYGSLWKMM